MSKNKTKPNRLLYALVVISLGIHLVIFMHISGLYRANALTYIEFALQDISKPPARSIPRPPRRPKTPPRPQELKTPRVVQRSMPQLKPMKIEAPDRDLPDTLMEKISMPDVPAATGLHIADYNPALGEASSDFSTSSSYLEMVRLRIERYKKYPDMARVREIEGSVTLRFVITPQGEVRGAEVVKSSRHTLLDTAALRAVTDAAPFPEPPPRLFEGEIPLELTIMFELS
ncbi:MAG: energy transducer TonB [Syntrophobacteria bacterium]